MHCLYRFSRILFPNNRIYRFFTFRLVIVIVFHLCQLFATRFQSRRAFVLFRLGATPIDDVLSSIHNASNKSVSFQHQMATTSVTIRRLRSIFHRVSLLNAIDVSDSRFVRLHGSSRTSACHLASWIDDHFCKIENLLHLSWVAGKCLHYACTGERKCEIFKSRRRNLISKTFNVYGEFAWCATNISFATCGFASCGFAVPWNSSNLNWFSGLR